MKLTEINVLGMPDPIMMHYTIYMFQQELLPLLIILPLFCMGTAVSEKLENQFSKF